jgi:hypothetical protein
MSDRSYIPLKVPAILLHVSDERCADNAGSGACETAAGSHTLGSGEV